MHNVRLSEELYAEAQRAAAARGFSSVEEFVAEAVQISLLPNQDNYDERLHPM
jgi:hypothetical protein